MRFVKLDEVAPTFRRNMNGKIQESCIDHVAWTGTLLAGSQVTKDGRYVTDHIPIIGWVNAELECDKSVPPSARETRNRLRSSQKR